MIFLTRSLSAFVLFCGLAVPALANTAGAGDPPYESGVAFEQSLEEHYDEPYEDDAPTFITSDRDVERLRSLQGISLQWIDLKERGQVNLIESESGVWRLVGAQLGKNASYVEIDGVINEIGPNFFDLIGTVRIVNTPDQGRICEDYDIWRFEVTQNRSYYRLRKFEWCDQLTDYVDIFFDPKLR